MESSKKRGRPRKFIAPQDGTESASPKPIITLHPKQCDYVANPADECLYAGSVGSGKTAATIADISRYLDRPHFVALVIRRTFDELEKGIINKHAIPMLHKAHSKLGGEYNGSKHMMQFPSGAQIWFGYCESDKDLLKYQGLEFNYLYIDELTQIPEEHFQWLKTRQRSSHGDPIIGRYTSNAGGPYHEWVFNYWRNWLDPNHPKHLKSGQVARIEGKTRAAVLCNIGDNPSLDPVEYKKQFIGMSHYMLQALWHNDWTCVPGAAEYFKRERIEVLSRPPNDIVKRVRSYDLAGSEAKTADYTSSILLGLDSTGKVVVEEVYRARLSTDKVEQLILNTAKKEPRVKIVLPLEPAAAGKAWSDKLSKMLHGYNFIFIPQNRNSGSKVTRAKPVSAQALQGNLKIVSNRFTKEFLDELEAFTDDDTMYANDDMVDALSQAYNELSKGTARFRTNEEIGFEPVERKFVVNRVSLYDTWGKPK